MPSFAGYGPVGRRLHESLSQYGIPCIIIDLNADTVKSLLNGGHLAFLGDIQHQITMDLAGVRTARLIAFTFPDPARPCPPTCRSREPMRTSR